MPLVNLARDIIGDAITQGGTYGKFKAGRARVGVGNSSTAFAATQTNLLGTALRKLVNIGYPQRSANVLIFQAAFELAEANFAWQERGIFNAGGTGGQMLSRNVASMGTKTNAESWVLTCTDTVVLV